MDYVTLIKVLQDFKQDRCNINETIDKIRKCFKGKGQSQTNTSSKLKPECGSGCVY